MNEFSAKWNEISSKGHDAGRFRVFPDHPLNFFLDYSLQGKREVVVDIIGEELQMPPLPIFQNIELSLLQLGNGLRFGLTLNDDDLSQSFSVMCYDLAQRSSIGNNVYEAMQIFLVALDHWAKLFKQKISGGLTRSETIGLIGELLVIEMLMLDVSINSQAVINGWRGPDKDSRDIGFNGTRIEVKTQLSTKAVSLQISSLEQLDDNGERIFVILNRISPSDIGRSLKEIVLDITTLLSTNKWVHSEFERKLELASYDDKSSLADEKFGLDQSIVYKVNDLFPRLTPSVVPQGIFSVNYQIAGVYLENFITHWETLLGAINE